MMKLLHILTGQHHGAEIPLSDSITLGSSDEADLQLLDTIQQTVRFAQNDNGLIIESNADFQWISTDRVVTTGREVKVDSFCLLSLDGIYCLVQNAGEKLEFCVEEVVAWFVHGTAPKGWEPDQTVPVTGPEENAVEARAEVPQTDDSLQGRWTQHLTRLRQCWTTCPATAQRNLVFIASGVTVSLLVFLASAHFVLRLSSQDYYSSKIVSFLNISKKDIPARIVEKSKISLNDAVVASEVKQLQGELLADLEKYSLRDYVDFQITPTAEDEKTEMLFDFTAKLTQDEDQLLQSLLQVVKKKYTNLKINGKVTIFEEKLPTNIAQIIYGQNPRVVDRLGKMYSVGDNIDGKKILSISRSRVMFRGKRDMVLTW